ncbi:MAG: hypothetical protein ABIQ16_04040 [Polyangiaceae bacterium]
MPALRLKTGAVHRARPGACAANETLPSRFRRETRIAGALNHPNLVNVLLLSELSQGPDRVPFLALEYLDGLSVRSALAARGTLPTARGLHVLLQIATQ